MIKSEIFCLNNVAPPESHINGSAISFTNHICNPIKHYHKTGTGQWALDVVNACKGAQVLLAMQGKAYNPASTTVITTTSPTGTPASGVLMVHLVEDADGVWFPLQLTAGGLAVACQFDAIGDSAIGTTVNVDDSLVLFPCLYSQETQP